MDIPHIPKTTTTTPPPDFPHVRSKTASESFHIPTSVCGLKIYIYIYMIYGRYFNNPCNSSKLYDFLVCMLSGSLIHNLCSPCVMSYQMSSLSEIVCKITVLPFFRSVMCVFTACIQNNVDFAAVIDKAGGVTLPEIFQVINPFGIT